MEECDECDLLIDGICTDCGKDHNRPNYRTMSDPDTRLKSEDEIKFEDRIRDIVS